MLTTQTQRRVATALRELKRNGYMAVLVMMNKNSDESKVLGSAMEVLCSETNDPQIVAAMALNIMKELTSPRENRAVLEN